MMIATRESKLPAIFSALVATLIFSMWVLGQAGALQIDGVGGIGFTLFVCLFSLPLAILLWVRVFKTWFVAKIDRGVLVLRSSELFSRRIRIPMRSIYDVRVNKKKILGDPTATLRLLLTDDEGIEEMRTGFRSVPGFGFYGDGFDCCPLLETERLSSLAREIQRLIRIRGEQDGAGQSPARRDLISEGS